MAQGTTSSSIEQLYADIVADLVPYYMDAVLLPNQQIITNSYTITGQAGDTLRIPLTNSWSKAIGVSEGDSILGTGLQSNLVPTAANITVSKYGVATNVTEESLEDGGIDMVRNAVLTRFAGSLALAIDSAGFATANASFTQNGNTGLTGLTGAGSRVNFVMSPEALAYAAKREPVVKMWFNPDTDAHEMRGTVRAGFAALRGEFGQRIVSNATVGAATQANIIAIAKGVANLRTKNAPTMAGGQYVAIIDPAFEYGIQEQIALAGAQTIGSLSDVGNRALLQGIIGQAAGVVFFRNNHLPTA